MLHIAAAQPDDLPDLAGLMEEMDRFYGVTEFEDVADRIAQIRALVFGNPPAAQVLLAREDGKIIGFASYSFLWPAAGLTRSLFLKELYVSEAERGHGVGRALMQRVLDIAAENRCSRVEWMTEHANADAQAFYERLGHRANTEKVFYRVQV